MSTQPAAVTPDETSPAFDAPDDAADKVSQNFGQTTSFAGEREQAAAIYQRPDGKYVHSTAVSQNHDDFSLRVQMPQGYKLAGIVHSHPGSDDLGQVFSPGDLDTADQLKVPSFIRFLKDDSIRKYTPGKTRVTQFKRVRVARGDPIDKGVLSSQTDTAAPSGPGELKVEGSSMAGLLTQASGLTNTGQQGVPKPASAPTPTPLLPGPNNGEGPVSPTPQPSVIGPGATPGSGTTSPSGSTNPGGIAPAVATNQLTSPAPTVPSLQSLVPNTPSANTIDPSSAGAAPAASQSQISPLSTAASQNVNLAGITNGQINPNDSTNSASQLDAITSANSPYIQLAEQQGLLSAASRGLENSSIASGASEAAAVAAAAPLAEQNASAASAGAEQNAQLGTQASEFNTSQDAAAKELQAQLGTNVSETNAQLQGQTAQFNASQTQAAAATNAAAQNAMKQQTAAIEGSINQQYLSGTQAQDLAAIQGQYNQLITSNQSASALYGQYMSSIGSIMANQNIAPNRVADSITAQQAMLTSGLDVIDAMNGMSLDISQPTTSTYNNDFTTTGGSISAAGGTPTQLNGGAIGGPTTAQGGVAPIAIGTRQPVPGYTSPGQTGGGGGGVGGASAGSTPLKP